MNISQLIKQGFGQEAYQSILRNSKNLGKEAKEAGEHFLRTAKTTMSDEVPEIEKVFDNLETASSNLARNTSGDRSSITDSFTELFRPINPHSQEAFGRYLHKVGGDSTFLEDMTHGRQRYLGDEERLSRLFDGDYMHGSGESLDNLDNVGRWMVDEATMDRNIYNSYKNSDAFYEDKLSTMFEGLSDVNNPRHIEGVENLNRMLNEAGFENIDEMKRAYDNYIRGRAWNHFDEGDRRLVESVYKDGTSRPILDEALGTLGRYIDDSKDLKPRDRLLNYTKRSYDTDKHPLLMSLDEALDMTRLGLGKMVGEIEIGGKKLARVIPIINYQTKQRQGVLRVEGKYSRGVESDLSKQNIQADHKAFDDLKKGNLQVETFVNKNTGEHVSAELVRQKYRQDRKAFTDYKQKLEDYNMNVTRPKNAEEFVGFAKAKNYEAHELIKHVLTRPTNRRGIMNAFKRNLNPMMYKGGRAAKERAMARDKEILDAVDDFLKNNPDTLAYGDGIIKPSYVPEPNFERYLVGRVIRPMSDAEQLAKGRIDNPATVLGDTISSIKNRKGAATLNRLIERHTVDIQNGAKDLTDDFGSQPLLIKLGEQKYDPIDMSWYGYFRSPKAAKSVSDWLKRNQEMLSENYVPIDKKNAGTKVDADYVHKHYAREMLGFEDWKATDGLGWQAQMLETLGEKGIQFIRENISIKNPAVLVNNMTAGVFMQITDGVPLKIAFRNTVEAFQDIKTHHELKRSILKLELKHGEVLMNNAMLNSVLSLPDGSLMLRSPNGFMGIPADDILQYARLVNQRKTSLVFQAEQDGILKSFLDEGLWDRIIRENPDEDAMVTIMKNLALTEDSKWGVNVRKWHDYTDMVNRLAMYRFYHTQATPEQLMKMKLTSGQDIKIRIDQMFTNYSRLLPPLVSALRRGGSIPFASWFYRAPPFLIKQARQHPVELIAVMGSYELAQTYFEGETVPDLMHTGFSDKYVGPLHADSKISQNVLRPGNWGDGFSQLGGDIDTYIPSYLSKIASGDLWSAAGISLRDSY